MLFIIRSKISIGFLYKQISYLTTKKLNKLNSSLVIKIKVVPRIVLLSMFMVETFHNLQKKTIISEIVKLRIQNKSAVMFA